MAKEVGEPIPVDDDAEPKTNKNPKAEAIKPKDVTLSFTDLIRAKKKPEMRGVVYVKPEEIGVDHEELGLGPADRVGMLYRPFESGENGEIRETIKDFPEDEWPGEYYDEIILRCLEEPKIPNNAEGRKVIAKWLPGTKQIIAQAVINQSGMGAHEVKSAKDELGKLSKVIPVTA